MLWVDTLILATMYILQELYFIPSYRAYKINLAAAAYLSFEKLNVIHIAIGHNS